LLLRVSSRIPVIKKPDRTKNRSTPVQKKNTTPAICASTPAVGR
jgi:hypothetical protein